MESWPTRGSDDFNEETEAQMQPQYNRHNERSHDFTEESEEQMQPGSNWHNGGSDDFNEETEAQMQPQSNWHNRGSDDLIEDSETQIQPESNRAAGRELSQLGFGLTSQISSQLDPSNTASQQAKAD